MKFPIIATNTNTGERVPVGDIIAGNRRQALARLRRARMWIVSNLANHCAFRADIVRIV